MDGCLDRVGMPRPLFEGARLGFHNLIENVAARTVKSNGQGGMLPHASALT
jgi:hypothetical protein